MNNEVFQNARMAYKNQDYAAALKGFTECLEDEQDPRSPGEVGLAYHQIGNCLVKLGDYTEAIHAFAQATGDASYDEVGAVNYNLGMAYAVLHDYEDAVRYFEVAVSDNRYQTPYKAYLGMGNALLRLGKSAEAGAAFRSAALDAANPDPTKALLNLGVCFMALDRPADAVTSYESALQFDMPAKTKNKLYANLGQAYVANNQFQQAISAFENALADKTYFLNDAASVDYQRAISLVSTGTAVLQGVKEQTAVDTSGLDVPATDSPEYQSVLGQEGGVVAQPTEQILPSTTGDEDRFFQASDEELEQWSRGVAKQQRKKHNVGKKIGITILVIIVLILGGGVFGYTQGYGYPTQESMTQQLFSNPDNATSLFSSSVDSDTIDRLVKPVVQTDSITIDGVDRTMNASSVYATAKTSQGGEVHYEVSFVRNLIGWKIDDIDLYFPSEN